MELLSSNIKKVQETETPKGIPYISGNGNPKKSFLYFGKVSLYFRKWKPRKEFFIFQESETSK